MSTDRALRIRAGGQELTVEVVADMARLTVREHVDDDRDVRVDVPARALVAAVRAAWADEHEAPVFEPWRGVSGYRDPYGYDDRDGYRAGWDPRDDDLGDGDRSGYRDPTVVPFRYPPSPPRPARSGQPWEPADEATIRAAWLAADPEADRDALLTEVAESVERPVGGLLIRLRQVGCDPTRPGCPLDQPWLTGVSGG